MKRERLKELLPVMQHYANGGEVEVRHPNHCWGSTVDPAWRDDSEYRIKPEPEYVPLEAEDWIKDGPWWFLAHEDDTLPTMVIKAGTASISWLGGGMTHVDAMKGKRRNATSDWMPCKKPKQ